MKNILVGASLLSLFALNATAQNGIHIQEYVNSAYVYNNDSVYMPASMSDDFNYMVLVNPNTKSWKYLNTVSYNKHMGPFAMKNAMEGVMTYSSSSKLYKTTDGWQTLNEVAGAPSDIVNIITTNAGYVAYQGFLKDFYFSADGQTWTLVLDAGSGTNVMKAFGNKVFIYTGNSSSNYVSTDGGQTFSNQPVNGAISGNFKSFVMLTQDTMVLATDSHLYKSYDGGQNWTEKTFPASIQNIIVKDSLAMFICTSSQNYYTSDGGTNWQTKNNTASGVGNYIGNNLYVWPSHKSTDNGTTWTSFLPQSLSNGVVFDVYFKNNIGLIGRNDGKINVSFDKGCSFGQEIIVPTSEDIMAVKILNNGDFIVGDRKSQVFYSSDNGLTWNQRYSNTFTYNAVKFSHSDDDSVIVETRLGQPVISFDKGNTFNFITVGGGNHSQTVKPNGQIIDAGGWFDYTTFQYKGLEIGSIAPNGNKTITDTLLISQNASTESVVDIVMLDNNVGYLMTQNTTTTSNNIYKTTSGWNGGTTFVGSISNYSGARLHVLSADTLMITATASPLYYSSFNGGVSWASQSLSIHAEHPTLYPSIKKGFFFDANNYIFALNNEGVYVNTGSIGSGPTSINENNSFINRIETELRIYPNPTKGNINIDYKGLADILICDYTGRVVYKKLKANTSEAISVSDFTDGLYIITLQTNTDRLTSRFIKQ